MPGPGPRAQGSRRKHHPLAGVQPSWSSAAGHLQGARDRAPESGLGCGESWQGGRNCGRRSQLCLGQGGRLGTWPCRGHPRSLCQTGSGLGIAGAVRPPSLTLLRLGRVYPRGALGPCWSPVRCQIPVQKHAVHRVHHSAHLCRSLKESCLPPPDQLSQLEGAVQASWWTLPASASSF